MNPRQRNATAYRPHTGDRVLDLRTGRTGIYMDTIGGEHYLRPEPGGCEWTADPTHVTPAPSPTDDDPDSDPAGSGHRRLRRAPPIPAKSRQTTTVRTEASSN